MAFYRILLLGDSEGGSGKSTLINSMKKFSTWNRKYDSLEITSSDYCELIRMKINDCVYEIIYCNDLRDHDFASFKFDLVIYMINGKQDLGKKLVDYIDDNSIIEAPEIIIHNVWGECDTDYDRYLRLGEIKFMYSIKDVITLDAQNLNESQLAKILDHVKSRSSKKYKLPVAREYQEGMTTCRVGKSKRFDVGSFKGDINKLIDIFITTLPVLPNDDYAFIFSYNLHYTPTK